MDAQFPAIQPQKALLSAAETVQRWKSSRAVPISGPERTAGLSRMPLVPAPETGGANKMIQALAGGGEMAASQSSAPSFGDFLDVINPLQHLPVINNVYRSMTGDTIGAVGQIIGGALFGGPLGAVMGTVNAVMEHQTGKDLAGAALGLVRGDMPRNIHTAPMEDPALAIERALSVAGKAPSSAPALANGFSDMHIAGAITDEGQYVPPRLSVSNINRAAMPQNQYNG